MLYYIYMYILSALWVQYEVVVVTSTVNHHFFHFFCARTHNSNNQIEFGLCRFFFLNFSFSFSLSASVDQCVHLYSLLQLKSQRNTKNERKGKKIWWNARDFLSFLCTRCCRAANTHIKRVFSHRWSFFSLFSFICLLASEFFERQPFRFLHRNNKPYRDTCWCCCCCWYLLLMVYIEYNIYSEHSVDITALCIDIFSLARYYYLLARCVYSWATTTIAHTQILL